MGWASARIPNFLTAERGRETQASDGSHTIDVEDHARRVQPQRNPACAGSKEVRCGCVARKSAHRRIPLNVGWRGLNPSTRGTEASTCLRQAESENLTRTQALSAVDFKTLPYWMAIILNYVSNYCFRLEGEFNYFLEQLSLWLGDYCKGLPPGR